MSSATPLDGRSASRWRLGRSLSGRLLRLTIGFALLAQFAVYVPIVAGQHQDLLRSRIAAAQTAVLALEETEDNQVSPQLKQELLANAGVKAVALKRDEARRLLLADDMPGAVSKIYDLRTMTFFTAVGDALETLAGDGSRLVRIVDTPRLGGGQFIEAIAAEKPIHQALVEFAWQTFLIGLAIAVATGGVVFLTLNQALVRPMRRLIKSMTAFRDAPEDPACTLVPSGRRDEIGDAEQALAGMQGEVRSALTQRAHLAAMGLAVAKINHDLRNLLAGAQIASERLEDSRDPNVRRLAPRLLRTLDRAIALTNDTLAYGKAGERPPHPVDIDLAALVADIAGAAGATGNDHVRFHSDIPPALLVKADSDQLYRILLNLVRNAVQAIEAYDLTADVTVSARRDPSLGTVIEVSDSGPGIPDAVLPHLFEAFGGGAKVSGTGLGLAIARELARGHGGDLGILKTDARGTTFRLTLPDQHGEREG